MGRVVSTTGARQNAPGIAGHASTIPGLRSAQRPGARAPRRGIRREGASPRTRSSGGPHGRLPGPHMMPTGQPARSRARGMPRAGQGAVGRALETLKDEARRCAGGCARQASPRRQGKGHCRPMWGRGGAVAGGRRRDSFLASQTPPRVAPPAEQHCAWTGGSRNPHIGPSSRSPRGPFFASPWRQGMSSGHGILAACPTCSSPTTMADGGEPPCSRGTARHSSPAAGRSRSDTPSSRAFSTRARSGRTNAGLWRTR